MDIKFVSGQFVEFIATRTFTLGSTNLQVRNGDLIQFDGIMARVNGEAGPMPQLKGAMKAGWVVPVVDYVEGDPSYNKPVSAEVKVRHPTKGGDPMKPPEKAMPYLVEGDEKIVTTIKNRTETVKRNNEEVEVRKLKTAAKTRTTVTPESAGSLIREAGNVQIDTKPGMTESDMLARMSEEEQQEYTDKKAALRSKYVPEVVGRVKKISSTSTEGIQISNSVGGGIETVDLSGSDGQPVVEVVEREGMRFTNTNCNKPKPPSSVPRDVSARHLVARTLCPDFPAIYDFSQPIKKRVARLRADFEDRVDVLRAAYAAETDDAKECLVAEFPEAFSG